MNSQYEKFCEDELILRDLLAVDRTILANERTFLAYIRTALAFLITGAGLIKFIDSATAFWGGWAFILCAAGILAFGIYRFHQIRKSLAQSKGKPQKRLS